MNTITFDQLDELYCIDCLNSDGDYSMSFSDWVNEKYPNLKVILNN